MLSADYGCLASEVVKIHEAGADWLHFDVMDGQFVPNITFGAGLVKSMRSYTDAVFDVHLMVNKPDHLIESFVRAGSDIITVHLEAVESIESTLALIKSFGIKAGVSIVPDTAEDRLQYLYELVDLILVMTVNPGFGGQEFMSNQLNKIKSIRSEINKRDRHIYLSVDGGINERTASLVKEAGADVLVAGTHLFKTPNYADGINSLR